MAFIIRAPMMNDRAHFRERSSRRAAVFEVDQSKNSTHGGAPRLRYLLEITSFVSRTQAAKREHTNHGRTIGLADKYANSFTFPMGLVPGIRAINKAQKRNCFWHSICRYSFGL